MIKTFKDRRKNIFNRAFTLIELLIVISIIGILAALATASYTAAQKQARDTARKSDLAQYRTSLESYANKNNGLYVVYPSKTPLSTTVCTALGLTICPKDPKDDGVSAYYYSYISDAAGTQYTLWAKLENVSSTTYWVLCSSGLSGKKVNSQPTDTSCTGVTP